MPVLPIHRMFLSPSTEIDQMVCLRERASGSGSLLSPAVEITALTERHCSSAESEWRCTLKV